MNTNKIYLLVPILILGALMTSFSHAEGNFSRTNVETIVLEMGANTSGVYFKPK